MVVGSSSEKLIGSEDPDYRVTISSLQRA